MNDICRISFYVVQLTLGISTLISVHWYQYIGMEVVWSAEEGCHLA
jgi:hypothetical protein